MTPTEYIYWFQGFLELSNAKTLSKKQLEIVKAHLELVLTNVTKTKAWVTPREITSEDIPKDMIKLLSDTCEPMSNIEPLTYCQPIEIEVDKSKLDCAPEVFATQEVTLPPEVRAGLLKKGQEVRSDLHSRLAHHTGPFCSGKRLC